MFLYCCLMQVDIWLNWRPNCYYDFCLKELFALCNTGGVAAAKYKESGTLKRFFQVPLHQKNNGGNYP